MNENTRTEVLASIDSMNEVVQESEFGVLMSLLDQVDKASVILENYNGNDLDMFSIYQEAEEATENKEGEGTAVQQGNPSGQVDAGLGQKKQNIFSKIWNFIKNVFKSIGNFIKKCWSGKVVPAAETVSEKANNVIEQISGKDENWIKANASTLGLMAANIGTAVILAKVAPDIVKDAGSIKSLLAGLGITAMGAANVTFAFKNGGIATTLAIAAIPQIITGIMMLFDYLQAKKNPDEISSTLTSVIDKLKGLFTNDEQTYDAAQVATAVTETKTELEKAKMENIPEYTDEEIEKMTPEEIKKDGENAKKIGVIGKITALLSKIFAKICDFLHLRKKIADDVEQSAAGETPEGETPTEGEGGDATADGGEVPAADAVENGEASTETSAEGSETTNEPTPGDGKSYTLDEVAQFMKDKFNFDIAVADGKPTRGVVNRQGNNYGTIPAGKDNHRFRPTGDGNWIYEEAEEDVDDGEDVVTESHSGYYWK
jgi:hypothetical protein